jgi:hypothetical protein
MKSKTDIESAREQLISAVRVIACKYGFSLHADSVTAEQLFSMALGALATTSFVLGRESETNFENLMRCLAGVAKRRKRVSRVRKKGVKNSKS